MKNKNILDYPLTRSQRAYVEDFIAYYRNRGYYNEQTINLMLDYKDGYLIFNLLWITNYFSDHKTNLPAKTILKGHRGDRYIFMFEKIHYTCKFIGFSFIYFMELKSISMCVEFIRCGKVRFNNSQFNQLDYENLGSSHRSGFLVNRGKTLKIQLGCFLGSEKSAIQAIKTRYGYSGQLYIEGVKKAFAKARKRMDKIKAK